MSSMQVLNTEIGKIDTTTLNAPAGAVTLTVEQSGTHFMCTPAAAASRTITLPSFVTNGLTYTFTKAGAGAQPLVFATGGHIGTIIRAKNDGSGGTSISGATSVTMAATAVVGDFIKVTSNGTKWVVIALSQAPNAGAAGITSA